jgi:hypothetical protein
MPDQVASRADFEHLINGYDGAVIEEHGPSVPGIER